MKFLTLMIAGLLVGCGTVIPLEELEQQALISGNWSEVEKRERILEQRRARHGRSCPTGYIAYCVQDFGEKNCRCMTRETFRASLY
ncbi:MAG: hypothetical protein R3176_10960 [Woeseiaceae bacterium]|nr:hypothetical protein [Woeseiaceae bacterium]